MLIDDRRFEIRVLSAMHNQDGLADRRQKIVIVDGAWASVGTANFDNRSFALNEETSVCVCDRTLVNRLNELGLPRPKKRTP